MAWDGAGFGQGRAEPSLHQGLSEALRRWGISLEPVPLTLANPPQEILRRVLHVCYHFGAVTLQRNGCT
eukprot:1155539-Pelagomonas_calceolata.AAC.1